MKLFLPLLMLFSGTLFADETNNGVVVNPTGFSIEALLSPELKEFLHPLERKIPVVESAGNFEEDFHQMEAKSGFKISCPMEVADFMRSTGTVGIETVPSITEEPLQKFLNRICDIYGLSWKFQTESQEILLDLVWKTSDSRTAAELLHDLQKNYSESSKNDPAWQVSFNALLSKDFNYQKAWKIRQKASFQRLFRIHGADLADPLLIQPLVSTSGEKIVMLLINHPIECYPGHGSVSYYWFQKDGKLIGAGLMNTGNRCKLVDAAMRYGEESSSDKASELVMKLNFNESRASFIARFILQKEGLKLVSLVDATGVDLKNDGYSIGKDLMALEKQ